MELKELEVATINLGPNDILVFRLPPNVGHYEMALAREHIKKIFPKLRAIVIGDGVELTKIKEEQL